MKKNPATKIMNHVLNNLNFRMKTENYSPQREDIIQQNFYYFFWS